MINRNDKVSFSSGRGDNLRKHVGIVESEGTCNPEEVLSIRSDTGLLYLVEARMMRVIGRAEVENETKKL